jgi:hypothetical protein
MEEQQQQKQDQQQHQVLWVDPVPSISNACGTTPNEGQSATPSSLASATQDTTTSNATASI